MELFRISYVSVIGFQTSGVPDKKQLAATVKRALEIKSITCVLHLCSPTLFLIINNSELLYELFKMHLNYT